MPAASGFARVLREAAPSLAKRFFDCSSRRHSSILSQAQHVSSRTKRRAVETRHLTTSPKIPIRRTQVSITCFRNSQANARQDTISRFGRAFSVSTRSRISQANTRDGPIDAAKESGSEGTGKSKSRKSTLPDTSSNTVAYWLLGSAASVFGIVVFGGLTRLTESGLSITEWKPVTGSLPPMSEEDWEAEFAKYRSSPEFHLLNSRMTLEEFKSIYWMEWIHRLWGRFIGISFVLPAVYFVARKQVSRSMAWRLFGIAGLIGFQGFIGWWMVKSGLKDDLFAPGSHPRVSQYRLTAHLGTAFICYLAMLWSGLDILRTNKLLRSSKDVAEASLNALRNPALKPFKRSVALLAGLVFLTAMSGGLVAGLDAGLIYNEFPYMGLGLTPPKSELWDSFYSRAPDRSDLWWRNMLENPSLVQLDHRILATTTFTAVMALWTYARSGALQKVLPAAAKRGVHGVVGFVWLQVILGISTLLYLVPTGLASAHQAGSLALLTWTVVLGSRVWFPGQAARILAQRMQQNVGGAAFGQAGGSTVLSQAGGVHAANANGATVLAASVMPAVTALGLMLSMNAEESLRVQLRARREEKPGKPAPERTEEA
ncbi:cytochrome c oxidase assembly protein subunit 15 [Capronia epimyces CBS 606.96]|uniref:Cytochrome c oxidase assembly protein subunit 15 n=1 Tax=Capronia epimyces CBS 606.96 TaxID=1182542 RepID=W9Y9L4_9EURO|nr:cytochrome c oxidase assembly protein subunit 15 [Capronia epimyces CBS 606.96]EXJ89537.1 cytochrome c oxidase assembly protein subunit 15 [Capronia epimyces CBS 606.96]